MSRKRLCHNGIVGNETDPKGARRDTMPTRSATTDLYRRIDAAERRLPVRRTSAHATDDGLLFKLRQPARKRPKERLTTPADGPTQGSTWQQAAFVIRLCISRCSECCKRPHFQGSLIPGKLLMKKIIAGLVVAVALSVTITVTALTTWAQVGHGNGWDYETGCHNHFYDPHYPGADSPASLAHDGLVMDITDRFCKPVSGYRRGYEGGSYAHAHKGYTRPSDPPPPAAESAGPAARSSGPTAESSSPAAQPTESTASGAYNRALI